jgi:hypothetical protein
MATIFSSSDTAPLNSVELLYYSYWNILLMNPLHGPSIKHRFQQYLYCCMRFRCLETALHATIFTGHRPTMDKLLNAEYE